MKTKVKIVVEGGKATPAPPLGPQLTMLGLKPPEVVKKINDKTKDFAGMKVPVEIEIDKATKEYELNVLMPSVSQLLIKEAGLEKGFGFFFSIVFNASSFDSSLFIMPRMCFMLYIKFETLSLESALGLIKTGYKAFILLNS